MIEQKNVFILVKEQPMYTERSRQSKLINNHKNLRGKNEKKSNHLKLMSPYYFSYETNFFLFNLFYNNILEY